MGRDLRGARPAGPGTTGAGPAGAGPLGPISEPVVVAVVPARNEAGTLPATLPALLAQEGLSSVVLVDDESSDATAAVARCLAGGATVPLEVVHGGPAPPGWAGKPWAMEQGARQALAAGATHLLFTDADILHGPGSVRRLLAQAGACDADLVSVMARLRAQSPPERLLVPAFVYFFALLYPFRWVARADRSTVAAAGGCLLVGRGALEASGGLGRIASARIDDLALARLVARGAPARAGRLWLGVCPEIRSIRAYPGLGDLWSMVARSADEQLRHSPALLLGTLAGLLWLFVVPPAATLAGCWGLARRLHRGAGSRPRAPAAAPWLVMAVCGATSSAAMAATYRPWVRYHGVPGRYAWTLPLAAVLYGGMTADSARRWRSASEGRWRGRSLVS